MTDISEFAASILPDAVERLAAELEDFGGVVHEQAAATLRALRAEVVALTLERDKAVKALREIADGDFHCDSKHPRWAGIKARAALKELGEE